MERVEDEPEATSVVEDAESSQVVKEVVEVVAREIKDQAAAATQQERDQQQEQEQKQEEREREPEPVAERQLLGDEIDQILASHRRSMDEELANVEKFLLETTNDNDDDKQQQLQSETLKSMVEEDVTIKPDNMSTATTLGVDATTTLSAGINNNNNNNNEAEANTQADDLDDDDDENVAVEPQTSPIDEPVYGEEAAPPPVQTQSFDAAEDDTSSNQPIGGTDSVFFFHIQ